jgi:hypothetical protein
MASPFKIFRKNAKVLLVGLFLLSMISFVVIPSFLQWLQTRQRSVVKSVVTTRKFGELSELELHNLWIEHNTVRRFLELLGQKIDQLRGNSFRIRYYLAMIGEANEEQLVRNWLLSKYAQASGMKITDRVVNAFIRGLINASGVGISQNDLAQLLAQNRIEEGTLFAGLERELLVLRYLQLGGFDLMNLQPGYAGEPPAMRWEYFLRFNRMASVELCGLPVDRYLDKVPMPNEQQIREYFEQYKTRLPDPLSPDPGFKVPAKVTVEYLKADFQKWLTNIKLEDKDLRDYYEQHKDEFFVRSTPAGMPSGATNPQAVPREESPQSGQTAPPTATDGGNKGDSAQTEEDSAPSKNPETAPPMGESQSSEMMPKEPEAGKTDNEGASQDQSFIDRRGKRLVQLVAYAEDTAPADAKSPAENPQNDDKSMEQASNPDQAETPADDSGQNAKAESDAVNMSPSQGTAPPAVEGMTSQETPGSEAAKSADSPSPSTDAINGADKPMADAQVAPQPEGPPQTEGPAMVPPVGAAESEAGSAQNPATKEPDSKYLPFDEVKERIRALVISERMQRALDELEESMRDYQIDWANFQTELEEAKKQKRSLPKEPPHPDFRKLAKEKQLDYVKVDEADVWKIADLDVGKSFDMQGVPFPRAIFDLREFIAIRTFDAEQNQYLCWAIAKTDEYVPDLDVPGVRDNVVRAWRMAEARKIADSELAKLVEKINKEQKSLSEFRTAYPDLNLPEVIQTEPFSWLTFGEFDLARLSMPQPRLSAIKVRTKDPASGLIVEKDAVENIGNEFMASVFSLAVGEVGKAWNRPQSKVYLVRVVELQPPVEQLRESFFRQAEPNYLTAGQFDLGEMGMRWMRSLEEEAGLKWNRAPHRSTRD